MPRISTSVSSSRRRRGPAGPAGLERQPAVVVAGAEGDGDLQAVDRQEAAQAVAPLDDGDGVVVEELVEGQVEASSGPPSR